MKNNKKGFTIVELVIVVTVIAILAAVFTPIFTSLVQKAKLTADEMAVKNMNTILNADEVLNGKPADYGAMRDILSANGISKGSLTPIAENHKFFWKQSINKIILVNIANVDNEVVVYPSGTEYSYDASDCKDLAGLPTAKLRSLKDLIAAGGDEAVGKTLVVMRDPVTNAPTLTLDTGVNFKADENYNMGTDESEYKHYNVDFLLEFSKNFDASHVENGNAALGENAIGFALLGSYQANNNGQWVPLPVFQYAGTPIRVMQLLNGQLGESEDKLWEYDFIAGIVKDFDCGIKAVYDDTFTLAQVDSFNYDAQTLSDNDKNFLNDLEVTIKLVMYETEEITPGSDTYKEVDNAQPEVIRVYKCTYKVVGDTLTIVEG